MTKTDPSADLDVLHGLAKQALDLYDLPTDATARLINLSENATYRIDAGAGRLRWALRLHRQGYHSNAAIRSELAWVAALRADGAVVTPHAVPGRDGSTLQIVRGKTPAMTRCVVLFDWEVGHEPQEDQDDLADAFEFLGDKAARMHLHVRRWRRPSSFTRHVWNFETTLGATPHWGRWRDGLGMTAEIEAVFQRTVDLIEKRLAAFGQDRDRFDLVHGDMRLANLLIDGPVTKVIDFDDCGFSWLMYDCATTVSFFEHKPQVPALIDAWVRGYRRVIDLPAADEREIQTFIMLRRLLLVAWISSHRDTDLARSMGAGYTEATVPLCETYLAKFG